MKDDMPWPRQPLCELVVGGDISYGVVQPGHSQPGGTPIVRVKDLAAGRIDDREPMLVAPEIAARHSRTALHGGELLVTVVGTVGEIAVVPPEMAGWNVARAIAVLRPLDVSSQWLGYCLQSPDVRAEFDSMLNTTVQATLNLSDLKRLMVPMPPAPQRNAIVEVLGVLDDKIAVNLRQSALADDLIAAEYQRAILEPGSKELPLLDACEVRFGEPFSGAHFSEPGLGRPLIRIRDLKTFTSQIWTTESRPAETLIQAGDIVVGMDAEFRPTVWCGEPGLLNQRVCRCTGRNFGAAYLREALKAPLAEIEGFKSATTVIHLNKSDLMRATLCVAAPEALVAFAAEAEPVFAMRVKLTTQNRGLKRMRDALLPALMSGKMRVKDAEKLIGGAL